MNNKYSIIIFLITGGMSALMNSALADHEPKSPNVLLILLDDLNVYQGVYGGHPQAITPNIDRLASQSVIFDNAHSPNPVCAPARAAMFTGILPHVSGNHRFQPYHRNPVLSQSKTLMTYLRENGYLALGAGKLMHHRIRTDWTEWAMDHYPGPLAYNGKEAVGHPSVPKVYHELGLLDGTFASLADVPSVPPSDDAPGYTGWWNHWEDKPFRYVNDEDRDLLGDELLAQWAVERINQLDSREPEEPPFFLAVGFFRPHTPLVVPQKYFDLFPPEKLILPVVEESEMEDTHFYDNVGSEHKAYWAYRALKEGFDGDIEMGLRLYLQAYLASITFADEQVGKVLTALDQSGLSDSTIVILTSDHGYHLGEKGILYKNNPWEETTRVPLIIRVPNNSMNAGKRVDMPVSLIDIYPTIVDMCDLTGDTRKSNRGAHLSGFSMKPLLLNPDEGEWDGPDVVLTSVGFAGKVHYTIRSRDWRYIRYANGAEELYYHKNDPQERKNLVGNPEYAAQLTNMRSLMKEQLGDAFGVGDLP